MINNNSIKDIPDISNDDITSMVSGNPDTFMKKINWLIFYFNFLTKSISLSKNFAYNSSIVDVEFLAGESKRISHLLGVRPKYRIILRQEGNGVLSDTPSSWDDKAAVIVNNGAVTVKATIMFLKE